MARVATKTKAPAKAPKKAEPVVVESHVVVATPEGVTLALNDEQFALNVQALLALRRDLDAAAVGFVH